MHNFKKVFTRTLSGSKVSGFTLIELLVVIAIIGVLSSVVVAMVGNANKKGRDSAIKTQLTSLRSEAEIYALNNGNSYLNLFTDNNTWASSNSNIQAILGYLNDLTTSHTAGSSGNQWAAQVQLREDTTKYACVDYTTEMVIGTDILAAGATDCP